MKKEVTPFLTHIQYFTEKYVLGKNVGVPEPAFSVSSRDGKPQTWPGKVEAIRDIEERVDGDRTNSYAYFARLRFRGWDIFDVEDVNPTVFVDDYGAHDLGPRRRLVILEELVGLRRAPHRHRGLAVRPVFCLPSRRDLVYVREVFDPTTPRVAGVVE